MIRPQSKESQEGQESQKSRFVLLGRVASRHPWVLLGIWTLIAVAASIGAGKVPALLFSGSGDIPASPSMRTDSLLRADFDNPYSQLLALAIRSPGDPLFSDPVDPDAADSPAAGIAASLEKALEALPQVRAVMTPRSVLDKRVLPAPGTGMLVLIGVKASGIRDAEQAIPVVRRVVDSVLGPVRTAHPALRWAVTGRSALTYDINLFNAKDTAEAEFRVIPLTLIILLFAFGSVVAAGVPVLLGILSTTVSLGIVFLMARHWAFSNLIQNVSSMIGLAVGIDYSLIIIHRYREALANLVKAGGKADGKADAKADGKAVDRALRSEALAESLATAGKAVFFSGLAVMIGLGGMLFTPLMETRSIGWGGCIVVMTSVAAALTFLPALLVVLGPILDWPKAVSRRFGGGGRGRRWEAWSHWVMKHAPWCAVAGLAAIAVLSLPGRHTRFGFPEGPFIPRELEFSRGFAMLDTMGMQGLVRPINIILTSRDGGPALTAAKVDSLYAFSTRIRKDAAVARIFGPVDLADGWPVEKYRALYADLETAAERAPFLKEFFLARDGRSLLMQVMLKPEVGLEQEKRLAREIPAWLHVPQTALDMGGQAVYYNDFDKAMIASYLPCLAFVLAVTLAALLLFFRSPLVSIKALVMNALSVSAGYGVVVWVFQLGHGHALFGAQGPAEVVPLTIPLMLFCILFGLSMDYEVFLLSRMREAFQRTGDNEASVAEGLAATGPMITSAALIMAAVFGAFAFARVVVVQMLGLGLAVSVLVDATLIRVLLVPAFMKMAGRWNWWPSRRI
jgi:putative drug exporter of the RND superfamily